MIGLAVLAGVAVYIALFWFVVRTAKSIWAKASALAIAVLIPVWDVPFGFFSYKSLCRHEGGLRVFQPISAQRTICLDGAIGYPPREVMRIGFDSVEIREKINRIVSYRTSKTGAIDSFIPENGKPLSRYCISLRQNQEIPWNIWRHDLFVNDTVTGATVARYSAFHWLGTWWRAKLLAFPGGGLSCHQLRPDEVFAAIREGRK